jgi:hypothetical protein
MMIASIILLVLYHCHSLFTGDIIHYYYINIMLMLIFLLLVDAHCTEHNA